MTTIYFNIPSDYTEEDAQTVREDFENFGGIIKSYNPLSVIVENPYDVEDMIGLGLDYGLSVQKTVDS